MRQAERAPPSSDLSGRREPGFFFPRSVSAVAVNPRRVRYPRPPLLFSPTARCRIGLGLGNALRLDFDRSAEGLGFSKKKMLKDKPKCIIF